MIMREGVKVELREDMEETKIMNMRFGSQNTQERVKLGLYELDRMEKFKYLGATITNTEDREPDKVREIKIATRVH